MNATSQDRKEIYRKVKHLHHLHKQDDAFCMLPTCQEALDAQHLPKNENTQTSLEDNFLDTQPSFLSILNKHLIRKLVQKVTP
jgi:hypothetical protein